MTKLYAVASESFDVYYNQALEKYLLDQVGKDEIILYLWRNDRTVVIGKNQDAYSECRIETLTHDGGFLARRISGGGAVYHDQGNLNFTFLCRKDLFNIERQDQIILNALNHLDIKAEKNGRNDLTWTEKIEYDLEYVENFSLWFDIKILFKTVGVVFKSEGIEFTKNDAINAGSAVDKK